jgi:hypothetical protein
VGDLDIREIERARAHVAIIIFLTQLQNQKSEEKAKRV